MLIVSNGTYPIDFGRIPKSVRFEFSLDAPNADLYRVTRGGSREQYEQLIMNLHEAVRLGYQVRPCYLMSRVNTSEPIITEIITSATDLGVSQIRLQRFKPWGDGQKLASRYEFSQDEYAKICSYARQEAKKINGLKVVVPQENRFLALGSVYVNPDGTVTVQGNDDSVQIKLGDLSESNLEEIWTGAVKAKYSPLLLRWLIRPNRLI